MVAPGAGSQPSLSPVVLHPQHTALRLPFSLFESSIFVSVAADGSTLPPFHVQGEEGYVKSPESVFVFASSFLCTPHSGKLMSPPVCSLYWAAGS